MISLNNFEAHGCEISRELGMNHSAGRVTYLAQDISCNRLVVIKEFQFAKTNATWDGYKSYV